MLNKPSWLSTADYRALLQIRPQLCAECGALDDLTVDHIVARHLGGTDDVSNLQILCRRHNLAKGIQADRRYDRLTWFDEPMEQAPMRVAQRQLWEEIEQSADWFTRPWSQIARRLYVLAWIVGSGKTLALAIAAAALNRVIRRDRGPGHPRIDRMLILTKETAIRDQLAQKLQEDLVNFGISARAPRVGVVTEGWQLDNLENLAQYDIVVACIQQLWTRDGKPHPDLAKILAFFPLIGIDEPHFAEAQVLSIVDNAPTSLCLGTTGSPIEGSGEILKRYVLMHIYDYQMATDYDHSLKVMSLEPEIYAQMVHEIDVKEADIQSGSDCSTIPGEEPLRDWKDNASPAVLVAERVAYYVYECDQEVSNFKPETAVAAQARRDQGGLPQIVYPVHALIGAENVSAGAMLKRKLNSMFQNNPTRYPRARGYHAELICSDTTENGQVSKGARLTPLHPWHRAYANKGVLDSRCARFLVVVGMAREGVDNPYCGVCGVACSTHSIVEVVQRAIGRQARAVIAHTPEGGLLVPPWRLDMPHIITHPQFNNLPTFKRGFDFVLGMRAWLANMPTLETLTQGDEVVVPAATGQPEDRLTQAERFAIAEAIGEQREQGVPKEAIDLGAITECFVEESEGRRRQAQKWAEEVLEKPEIAREGIGYVVQVRQRTIVLREQTRTRADQVTDAELENFLRLHKPELAEECLPIESQPSGVRRLAVELYGDYIQQFHNGIVPPSKVTVQGIRLGYFWQTWPELAPYVVGSEGKAKQAVHAFIGKAVKDILGADDEGVRVGGQFDHPQHHHMLQRPDVGREITSYARAQMFRQGYCPRLATAFGVTVEANHGEA